MKYDPTPIDCSRAVLSPEIERLGERLAEHVHDLWARQRLDDGWTFGPSRDDARKQHPCLIPYAELPESEKQYDRKVAFGTLKAIVALGYRIEIGAPAGTDASASDPPPAPDRPKR